MDTGKCERGGYARSGTERATKIISSLRNLSHEERLKRLGMFSLRSRRLRGEMIEMFKIIHGTDKVNLGKLFV